MKEAYGVINPIKALGLIICAIVVLKIDTPKQL